MAASSLPSAQTTASAFSDIPEQLPHLPEPAVACILQHVPLQQRLTCCALVCRWWAAAAAAAPADVDIQLKSTAHCQQLQNWLDKHGAVVVRLRARGVLFGDEWPILQVPLLHLTQLRSLDLSWRLTLLLPVTATPHSSSTGSRGSLPGTTSSSAAGSIGSAAAAVVLPHLRELALWSCELSAQLLSQLLSATALTKLHWSSTGVCQQPSLNSSDDHAGPLDQEQPPATLWQHLQLLPQLSVLTLRVDRLTAADLAPLSNLQRLQHLDLRLHHWAVEDDSGPRELLTALQHLTQLKYLKLHNMELFRVNAQPQQEQTGSYQPFAALTASTQLTALILVEGADMPVPQAAFAHMFPPGWDLPHLKVLHLSGMFTHPCVEATQIAMIAASCPALQELTLSHVVADDFDSSCLAQLPSGVTQVGALDWVRPAA